MHAWLIYIHKVGHIADKNDVMNDTMKTTVRWKVVALSSKPEQLPSRQTKEGRIDGKGDVLVQSKTDMTIEHSSDILV